jgi:hypothetical protein
VCCGSVVDGVVFFLKYPRGLLRRKELASDRRKTQGVVSPYSLLTLLVPVAALIIVILYGNLLTLNYIHILTGGTWGLESTFYGSGYEPGNEGS